MFDLAELEVARARKRGGRPALLALLALFTVAVAGCGSERVAGRFVVASSYATPNVDSLFVIGTDGHGFHAVPGIDGLGGSEDPDWSPDGKRIVFDQAYDCAASLGSCSALWVVDVTSSAEQRLTPENARGVTSSLSPTWSPDGRRIAYEVMNDRTDASDIWVMNSDGSSKRRLTHFGDAGEPAWAPDGKRIAFSHDGDIFVFDLDLGSLQRLTRTPALFKSYPDWSPDGRRIAYELNNPSPPDEPFQEYDAYVMDADGSHQRRLSHHGDADGHPVWSPHGKFIAYTSDDLPTFGDALALVVVDANSGRLVKRIAVPDLDNYAFDWTAR